MEIMNIELAKDLFHFQPINEKSFSPSANQSDMDTAAKDALIIAKTHIDKISNYFGTQLERIALSFDQNSTSYHFYDKNEAVETLKISINQIMEPQHAERVAYLTINSMLKSLNQPSAFQTDEDNIAITILIASTIDNYRHAVAHELLGLASNYRSENQKEKDLKNRNLTNIQTPTNNRQHIAFNQSDRNLLQELASILEKETDHPGFIDFQDISDNFQACGVGIKINDQKIIVASFVGGHGPNGFECSVRNFQNEPIPGMPSIFSTLGQAIGAHRDYFAVITGTFRKKKPWWKQLLQ